MNTLYYAGIGSRKIPKHVESMMTKIATRLSDQGFILRSGGAVGSDSAFENGSSHSVIYLANMYYVKTNGKRAFGDYQDKDLKRANASVRDFHPAPSKLKGFAFDLMSRNFFQAFGFEEDPITDIVVCWTDDGSEGETSHQTGGTGQMIRIAYEYGIPIVNLRHHEKSSVDDVVDLILRKVQKVV